MSRKNEGFVVTTMSKKSGQVSWLLPKIAVSCVVSIEDETVYYHKEDGNMEEAELLHPVINSDGCTLEHLTEEEIRLSQKSW